jgi:hypothetical protein
VCLGSAIGLAWRGLDPTKTFINSIAEFTRRSSADDGLRQLIDDGDIRPATQADVNAWQTAASRRLQTGNLAPYRSKDLYLESTYVVLRDIQLPPNMYGAHSRSFIIPAGVPLPKDPGSHNSYYLLGSGTCIGTACASE